MKVHDSHRGHFAHALFLAMEHNKDIVLLTGDLGYKMLDRIAETFPDRFYNCGASEQAMVGIACGMAWGGKKPFVYSITPFLLCRPFEWLRNYLDYESAPVRLIGSGMDKDYLHDGMTHWAEDCERILNLFPNIRVYCPTDYSHIYEAVLSMVADDSPAFLGLRR